MLQANENHKYLFANAIEIDLDKCIKCGACARACQLIQKTNYLKLEGAPTDKPENKKLLAGYDENFDCIYCGQCTLACPVRAAHEQTSWQDVQKILENPAGKVVVVQFAPAIRASIGEEFQMPHGSVVTGQIVTALRKLGFHYVFDTNFAADITTIVEAEELVDRIKNHGVLPMFTSCCPAWIKYLEYYRPDLIPHLTTSRSPQIHLGGIIKTYWAEKMKLDPQNIITVSVMPCTAKKFESAREEMKINNMLPTDYEITTREFAEFMRSKKIDFANLTPSEADHPLGEYTGAAAIYGATGGVMESALRTALHILTEKNDYEIEFTAVRGLTGIKEASLDLQGKKINIAVVNGIGNVKPVLDNLNKYHYIEVMACPGGCIGGGGQPKPTTDAIREKRLNALYQIDKNKKLRQAHLNEKAKEIIKWLQENKLDHEVLHTHYVNRQK